jgi:7-cyano-7-deazaguanine synthase
MDGLPSTFVPGRNLLMLTAAASYAAARDVGALVTGVCQTDFSGYPDCRESTMQALERAIVQGLDRPFVIHTPLMHIDKADTFLLAQELGVLDLILEESHTCYEGDHTTRHAWGYGCGACPACELRARGWHAYKERHP